MAKAVVTKRSTIRDMGSTSGYRLLQLALAFVVNSFTIRILTDEHGLNGYALYALIGSFLSLLPFADLGLGVGLVNATSDLRSGRIVKDEYDRIVRRTRDTLLIVSVVLLSVDVVMLLTGTWGVILGNASDDFGAQVASSLTLAALALTLPFGIGARILQGLHLMRVVTMLGVMQPFIQAAGILVCWAADLPAFMFAVVPAITYFSSGVIVFCVSHRKAKLRLGMPLAHLFRPLGLVYRISASAVPFLIISMSMAVAFQTARLLLAQIGSVAQLAEYSFIAQYFAPMLALVTVSAQNLWPRYRDSLNAGSLRVPHLLRHVALFLGLGLGGAGGLAIVVLGISRFVLKTDLLDVNVLFAACIFLVVMAVHQPSAMLLSSPTGLAQQAGALVLMAAVNVWLTIMLIPVLGSAAPYWSSTASVLIIAALPTFLLAVRRIRASSLNGSSRRDKAKEDL
ncbi:hypothetical protein [Cryobacterium arcticum]|uniref:Polysaccharide biosynthesis protein n=1 Tax=Cryobacterium arcticum TaxID=670052 RepID=A0A1B1BFU7_9MICO|nr:hypothetical protein [Cryobacterium arcticum]ANP71455.1 hypothetical protein PA27867_0484 [Cryobacterium arcticum]